MNCDPEVTLITDCLTRPEGIEEAAAVLADEDFHSSECRTAFRIMKQARISGLPVDFVFLYDGLRKENIGHSEAIELIERISDGQPAVYATRKYALKVLENAKKRRLTGLLAQAQGRTESLEDPAEVLKDTMERYQDIQAERIKPETIRLDEVSLEVLNELASLRQGDSSSMGIQTGIEPLDIATRGIGRGEFWIVGALPGRGKSAFGMQVAMNAINHGIPAFYISLEMSAKELFKRILASECGSHIVRNPGFSSKESFSAMIESASSLSGLPLYVSDAANVSTAELMLQAQRAIRKHGIKLVIVDYLQLVAGRGKELRERVGEVGNSLRQLAKESQVGVIALSQLSRPQNINEPPTMLKLKESGDLEAHAHTVLLLYMPLDDDQKPTGEDEIIIGKHRNGAVGSLPVFFDRSKLLFRTRERV